MSNYFGHIDYVILTRSDFDLFTIYFCQITDWIASQFNLRGSSTTSSQSSSWSTACPSSVKVNSQGAEEPEDAIVINGNRYFELQLGENDKNQGRILYTFDQSAFVEPKSNFVYYVPMNPFYYFYGK